MRRVIPVPEDPAAVGLASETVHQTPIFTLEPEPEGASLRIEALVSAAFGPGRLAKTAERLREGNQILPQLSAVARVEGEIVGTVRVWPIRIGAARSTFLGPIAVDPACRCLRIGEALVRFVCETAEAKGLSVLLVGDPPYFGRFGFVQAPKAILPGPVNPGRVLIWMPQGQCDVPAGAVQKGW
ncbi:MAG: GNAT family N-acetyltransferase [Asticcacaulis sp.]